MPRNPDWTQFNQLHSRDGTAKALADLAGTGVGAAVGEAIGGPAGAAAGAVAGKLTQKAVEAIAGDDEDED
jgi:hypothetical protein